MRQGAGLYRLRRRPLPGAIRDRPIGNRWRIGLGAFVIDDMIEDENRTITLRLDSMWSAGVGFEWQWKDTRSISATLSYLEIDEAPLTSPDIPGIGSVTGRFTERQSLYLEIGMSVGPGAR